MKFGIARDNISRGFLIRRQQSNFSRAWRARIRFQRKNCVRRLEGAREPRHATDGFHPT